jgi:nudix-type nucleoside diphosphatase (YffH/AdpP family)
MTTSAVTASGTLARETYDRGNGATILLYSKAKQTVVLTRQLRFPAFVNGHDGLLIETCAGLLDNDDPHTCIRKGTQKETGYIVQDVRKVFEAFMSPGSVTDRVHVLSANTSTKTSGMKAAGWKPRARRSRCWNCLSTRPWA